MVLLPEGERAVFRLKYLSYKTQLNEKAALM